MKRGPEERKRRRQAIGDALMILLATVMLVIFFCVAMRNCAPFTWIKLVDRLPIPGSLKMWLWGWGF